MTYDKTMTLSALMFDRYHIFIVQLAQFSSTFASALTLFKGLIFFCQIPFTKSFNKNIYL